VLGPLTHQPNNLTVARGQLAGFECHAPNSFPPARATWFKDSSPLVLTDRVLVSQETGTLFLRNVTAEVDGGVYHCVLENSAGSWTSREATLTVATTADGRK
jgi:hypothetical protein